MTPRPSLPAAFQTLQNGWLKKKQSYYYAPWKLEKVPVVKEKTNLNEPIFMVNIKSLYIHMILSIFYKPHCHKSLHLRK